MIIANPIYDSVFKRLIEDIEIAKEFIGRLIQARVIELDPRPQEMPRISPALGVDGKTLRYFRMDYAAIIEAIPTDSEEKPPNRKKVLIELQRASEGPGIVRFRNYLSAHYAIPVPAVENRSSKKKGRKGSADSEVKSAPPEVLPIIAIYLVGFNPFKVKWPIIRVDPVCRNAITGQVELNPESEFVEALNHTSVIVQLRRLSDPPESDVERAVTVFKQRHGEDILPVVEVPEWMLGIDDPLLKRMLRCLEKVSADKAARRLMEAEDEAWSMQAQLEHIEKLAGEERKLKEAALQREEEAKQREEEAKQREADERTQKEAALHREKEARQREGDERRQKETAVSELKKLRAAMKKAGLNPDKL